MSATKSVGATGIQYIDGVLAETAWAGTTLTYRFPTGTTEYEGAAGGFYTFQGFQTFNADQRAVVLEAFDMITAYTGLAFQESTATNVNLRFAEADVVDGQSTGTAFAYLPSTVAWAGDAFFNTTDFNDPYNDSYAYTTILHELGHAMGLEHGHEDSTYGALPAEIDGLEFSLMTYRSVPGGSTSGGYTAVDFPQTYMSSDIAALQHMYGANFSHNSGDTVYAFDPTEDVVLRTIWDGNGNDTYDFSAYTSDVSIDLNPGSYSTVADQRAELDFVANQFANGTVHNAHLYQGDTRSLIENVIGGSGNDAIVGNDGANHLTGGGGNDAISGGLGIDWAFFEYEYADYTISYAEGVLTLVSGFTDTVQDDVEWLDFSGTAYSFSAILDDLNGVSNEAPVVTMGDLELDQQEWIRINNLLSATDADGDVIVQYEIMDLTNENSFWVNGGVVDATSGYTFDAAALSGAWIQGASVAGIETLSARAYDGSEWGGWTDFTLTTNGSNQAPVVTANDFELDANQVAFMSDFVDATDADLGDFVESYEIWDSSGANSFLVNGSIVDAKAGLIVGSEDIIEIQGDATPGQSTLWVRASDGTDWSDWVDFTMTTTSGSSGANSAPFVTMPDLQLDPQEWLRINDLLVATDFDGDAIVQYEVIDSTNEDSFWVNGGVVDATSGYTFDAAALSGAWVQGATTTGVETLSARAYDGIEWGDWTDFTLTTGQPNAAPIVTADDFSLAASQSIFMSDVVQVADTDVGDAVELYELWDAAGADSFLVNGESVDATTGYIAFDFDLIEIQADATAGSSSLWVRANDGDDWSNWESFDMQTI